MMIELLSNRFTQISLAVLLSLSIAIPAAYDRGIQSEKLHTAKQQLEMEQRYQQQILFIADRGAKEIESQSIKYGKLKDELSQVNDNLRSCTFNSDSLRKLRQSANLPTTTSASIHARKDAREPAASQSSIDNFTCEDLSETLVEHDRYYFKCKTALEAWQARYELN